MLKSQQLKYAAVARVNNTLMYEKTRNICEFIQKDKLKEGTDICVQALSLSFWVLHFV